MAETVQLFITCLLDMFYPEVGESVVHVLEKAGAKVDFPPGQTCCGQPAFNAGMRRQARPLAIQTIQTFEQTRGSIVVPSGSCADMLRHGYAELFADEPGWLKRAQVVAERVYEFTEYLVDKLGAIDLGASYSGAITYHASCHLLRGIGVDRQPRALLSAVRGTRFEEMKGADECCGFGGVFSIEFPQVSAAMLERKIANLHASGAPLAVACDAGCMMHINGGLHRRGFSQRVVHIATLLDGKVQL